MAITPWYAGDTAPLLTIQLLPDSGVVDITGLSTSSFTLVIRNSNAVTQANGQGTFSALTAAVVVNGVVTSPASIQYQLSSSDIAVGLYHLYLKVQFGTRQQTFDCGPWQVVA